MTEQRRKELRELPSLEKALDSIDWQQVVLNGGPPCFHVEDDGWFCLRAERWAGHGRHVSDCHEYVPLKDLAAPLKAIPELLDEIERLEREREEVAACVREEWVTAKAIYQQECEYGGSTDAKKACWNRVRTWERFARRLGIELEVKS